MPAFAARGPRVLGSVFADKPRTHPEESHKQVAFPSCAIGSGRSLFRETHRVDRLITGWCSYRRLVRGCGKIQPHL